MFDAFSAYIPVYALGTAAEVVVLRFGFEDVVLFVGETTVRFFMALADVSVVVEECVFFTVEVDVFFDVGEFFDGLFEQPSALDLDVFAP